MQLVFELLNLQKYSFTRPEFSSGFNLTWIYKLQICSQEQMKRRSVSVDLRLPDVCEKDLL